MPMKNFSTQCMDGFVNKLEQFSSAKKSAPKRQTMDFLTKFARAYHAEVGLQENLCGLVLN